MIELALAPRTSWRRHESLALPHRLHPTIEKLTAAAQQEATKRPEVVRLMTHPGVGTARSRTSFELERYPFDWVLITFLAFTEPSSVPGEEKWRTLLFTSRHAAGR